MGDNPIQLAAVGAAALCGALGVILFMRRLPRWGFVLWTATLFFTPVWLGASVQGIFLTAFTGVTILAILAGFSRGLRWSYVDSIVVVLFLTLMLAFFLGGSVAGHIQETLLVWFVPYAWGRVVLGRVDEDWIAKCIAIGAVVAALLAILEFLTGDNIFLSIPGASSSVWGEQRERAGLTRVEGAFGHSIALGGTLSMASAFILSARWPVWVRSAMLTVVGVAVALTFSRLGLVGYALTIVLAVVFLGAYLGRGLRITATVLLGIGLVGALPVLLQVFGEAGAEAEGSADYRFDLLPLINSMQPIGLSPAREVLATGEDYWGGFRSIDSALILIGLRYGFVVVAILLLLLGVLVTSLLRGRATPAAVALVAQIPAFATVALITQYAAFVWFAAGLAVASYTLRSSATVGDRREQGVFRTQEVGAST